MPITSKAEARKASKGKAKGRASRGKAKGKARKGKAKGKASKEGTRKPRAKAQSKQQSEETTDHEEPSKSTYRKHKRCGKLSADECPEDPDCLCSAIRNIHCVLVCDFPIAVDIGRMNDRIDYLTQPTFPDEDKTPELLLLTAYRAAINENLDASDSGATCIFHIDKEIRSLCASGKNRERFAALQKDTAQLARSFGDKAKDLAFLHLGLGA